MLKALPFCISCDTRNKKGKRNSKQIGEIENFLIQNAAVKNSNLQNLHGTEAPRWSISGVIRGGKGKPRKSESEFKRLLGLSK